MAFLNLPAEIRDNIYNVILAPDGNRTRLDDGYASYDFRAALALTLVNQQVRAEAIATFHKQNAFVAVETPWREALPEVVARGRVPIVVAGDAAETFKLWTMLVEVRAPDFPFVVGDKRRFIIHVDDLPAFCQTWYYSDLERPGLNPHLELRMVVKDPRSPGRAVEGLSLRLQERLMLPFGQVKDLRSVRIGGNPLASVQDELKRRMETPHESPESCLRRAIALKDEGNAALKLGKCSMALEKYRLAWLAIHIVVRGRARYDHAEAFFAKQLTEEPFAGSSGQAVRMALRIKLVANTVAVYLKMDDWREAIFWGERSISMLRAAIGLAEGEEAPRPEDEAVLDFVGAADMGKIYFRVAMAWKALDDNARARQLLKVAQVYLPRDRRVAEEAIAVAPRLG